jgi:hypothetical protein
LPSFNFLPAFQKNWLTINADKKVIIKSILFIVLYALVWILSIISSLKDDGLGRAYLSLFLIGLFFLIAITITITNFYSLKNITHLWIKFLAFVPIIISLGHIGFVSGIFQTEIKALERINFNRYDYWVTAEIRASDELIDPRVYWSGSSSWPEYPPRKEGHSYVYTFMRHLAYEDNKFYMHIGGWYAPRYTQPFKLNIDQDKPASFTSWEKFCDLEREGHDPVKLEVRYYLLASKNENVSKPNHTLTVEIRTHEELNRELDFSLYTSKRKWRSDATVFSRDEDNFYIRKFTFPLCNEEDRRRYVHLDKFYKGYVWEAPNLYLNVELKPNPAPFTNWEELCKLKEEGHNPVKLEIRYSVSEGKEHEF